MESAERVDDLDLLNKLAITFEHLPPSQVPPRLQKDYDYCTTNSEQILSNLFDRCDISNKSLLSALLNLMLSYGSFRIAQITYHIESDRDEVENDLRYTPIIAKTKWYDMTPLLPPAGTIGWKALLIHTSVKDPDQMDLVKTRLRLLNQKLQFHAIISQLDRFRNQHETIKKNGLKVAEKLAEQVFDSANDDEEVVDLDAFQFNLMSEFVDEIQLAALIEALIKARLKTNLPPELTSRQEVSAKKLTYLMGECLMNRANLQETFVIKLIEQLRANLIRRKRRLSHGGEEEEVKFTLENVLDNIMAGSDPIDVISGAGKIRLSSKNLQRVYVEQWIKLLMEISKGMTLTPKSSVMIALTLSVLLVSASAILDRSLNTELSLSLAIVVDATTQRKLDKFFKICGPKFLIELTKQLTENTELLDNFDTPVMRFYRSYFARYMRHSTLRGYVKDCEKFSQFIEFICDKTISKSKSHILEYIFLCELSEFLDSLGARAGNKIIQLYVDYGKVISKKLYKFIKHRPFKLSGTESCDMHIENSTNGGNGSKKTSISLQVQAVVIDALVCIIKIAVNRNEQQLLDTYGELMLNLYNLVCCRFEELVRNAWLGRRCEHKAVDPHLHRLINLYSSHKSVIEPYLFYDLNAKICESLFQVKIETHGSDQTTTDGDSKEKKVAIYEDLKRKLDSVAEKSTLVYQTYINGQYSTVTNQTISQVNRIGCEDVCYKHYLDHLITISEVLTILSQNCDLELYDSVLNRVVHQLETCDALDHPKVLFLFFVLESMIPKQIDKDIEKTNSFKRAAITSGFYLIRIAKSVELGPSVISFTNAGTHKSIGGIQCCTYSHCMRVHALIFDRYPANSTNSLITDAMQLCISSNLTHYAKYSYKLGEFFIQLASSISRLLKAVSMGRRDIVEQAMPVFLSVAALLIRCIILASDRQKLEDQPKLNGHSGAANKSDETDAQEAEVKKRGKLLELQLEHLAHDVGRLLNNLCFLETKLVDYAPHLISTYIKDTQRASCPDFVKKHLDEGMFRIFNLVDSFQKERQEQVVEDGTQRKTTAGKASGSLFEMIHARLDQASREIFKDMHDEYNRFHRYLGKC